MTTTWITGGTVVLENGAVAADLEITDGILSDIRLDSMPAHVNLADVQHIDATGLLVLPGMIDLHTDAIEKEVQPRPGTQFPLDVAFRELERRMVSNGITMAYHSLSMSGGEGVRSNRLIEQIVEELGHLRETRTLMRHRVHLRYELSNFAGRPLVEALIREGRVHLLSYMDHSPGQGQFKNTGNYANYLLKTYGAQGVATQAKVQEMERLRAQRSWDELAPLTKMALAANIKIASHDDDEAEKVDMMRALGVTISEFPINLHTAHYAKSNDMFVSVGAPNIVRGGSHTANLNAREAVHSGAANMVCSDYHPPSMLAAVFQLIQDGRRLAEAAKLVSLYPAQAVGIDADYGSIQVGKKADLVLVERMREQHTVRYTLIDGRVVYAADYHLMDHA